MRHIRATIVAVCMVLLLCYLGGKGCCDSSSLGKEIRVHEKSSNAEFFIHRIKTITHESDLKSQYLVSGIFCISTSKLSP